MNKITIKAGVGAYIGFLSVTAGWPVYAWQFWAFSFPAIILMGFL